MRGTAHSSICNQRPQTSACGYLLDFDVQLMCRVRDGDLAAYNVLWERHRNHLLSFLHRMVAQEFIAEELAQEVFMRVYRSRHSYEPNARFTTWLFRIATHVAINWMRDSKREKNRKSLEGEWCDGLQHQVADYRPSIEQLLIAGVCAEEIRSAVERLPVNQRAAVIMHKYREFNYAEIARTLNCSESAVKSLLFRAYERLRVSLAHLDECGQAA